EASMRGNPPRRYPRLYDPDYAKPALMPGHLIPTTLQNRELELYSFGCSISDFVHLEVTSAFRGSHLLCYALANRGPCLCCKTMLAHGCSHSRVPKSIVAKIQ